MQEFISYVKKRCKSKGIKCRLSKTKKVKCFGTLVSGYFDDENKVLVCSMNRADSLEILAHEYCHFTQWYENCDVWDKANKSKCFEKLDSWLNGKKYRDLSFLDDCMEVELDNEKRVVNLIDEFDLPIDKKKYIQKANSYIYFYQYMKEIKRWCKPNNTPYSNKELISIMPTTFQKDYSKIPFKILNKFRSEGI